MTLDADVEFAPYRALGLFQTVIWEPTVYTEYIYTRIIWICLESTVENFNTVLEGTLSHRTSLNLAVCGVSLFVYVLTKRVCTFSCWPKSHHTVLLLSFDQRCFWDPGLGNGME